MLERFDLSAAGERAVRTYSGGMRRRLDLAATLVGHPLVLLLDEPTAGLDPRSRIELWRFVDEVATEGTTVVLTSQYLEEVERLAQKIVVIDQGRVIAQGSPEGLKRQIGGDVLQARLRLLGEGARDRNQLVEPLGEQSPTPIHVDPRDPPRLRSGLADERPVLGCRDRKVLVASDHEVDRRKPLRQPAVVVERQMRDGDDDRGALGFQRRNVLRCGREGIDETRMRQPLARDLGRRQHQPDESDLQRAERLHEVRRRAADRPFGPGVDDVRDYPLPVRLAHALQQHIVAEIELVVAERGEIESGGVERGHHLLALEHARGH